MLVNINDLLRCYNYEVLSGVGLKNGSNFQENIIKISELSSLPQTEIIIKH